MTTLATTLVFYYFLGTVWAIGPFTDLQSCESARQFQLRYGVQDVTECVSLSPSLSPSSLLTPVLR